MAKVTKAGRKEEYVPLLRTDDNEKEGEWEVSTTGTSDDVEKPPYPTSVFFILSTETCERFSYYGMRTILSLYLRHLFTKDGMSTSRAEDVSTILYHTFVFLSYFTALFGALLADSFFGKFKTIFYISILYAVGQATLTIGAVPDTPQGIAGMPQQAVSYIGLLLIAFGTGGIKPCVVSFGAEQFQLPQQQQEMSTFFGVFYACINVGSMISTIVTPLFRDTECLGEDECYWLAFCVPAVLMVLAIFFFVCGRPGYKVISPERNVVALFTKCVWTMATKDTHVARVRYGNVFVSEVNAVLKVCVLFLTYPLFWALYDQQGSRWTFQASRMNGRIGNILIRPDQMQVINAALILIFIPIFDKCVYPLCARIGFLKTPLQKIITGGVLLAFSFVLTGGLELVLEKTYAHPPAADQARLSFHNGLQLGCGLRVEVTGAPVTIKPLYIDGADSMVVTNSDGLDLMPFHFSGNMTLNVAIYSEPSNKKDARELECPWDAAKMTTKAMLSQTITLRSGRSHTILLYETRKGDLAAFQSAEDDLVEKTDTSYPNFRAIYRLGGDPIDFRSSSIVVVKSDVTPSANMDEDDTAALWPVETSVGVGETKGSEGRDEGEMKVCVVSAGEARPECAAVRSFTGDGETDETPVDHEFEFRTGASYNLYLQRQNSTTLGSYLTVDIEEITPPNSVHIAWLIPQYIVLTAGEVLFSITSLAFAFTQAPESMKAVVQALYLLTTAVGNLIDLVLIAALIDVFSSQAYEFFLFAGLMLVDMAILTYMACRYEYVDFTSGFHYDDDGMPAVEREKRQSRDEAKQD